MRMDEATCVPSRERRILYITNEYLTYLEDLGLSPVTIHSYGWTIKRGLRSLADAERPYDPKMIREQEIRHLRSVTWGHLKPPGIKSSLSIIRGLLEYHENTVMSTMRFVWPQDTRTNVDWLTPEQAMDLEDQSVGKERLIVHLELCLGLRLIEVTRLTLDDIDMRTKLIHIHGKGRGGGKWRSMPFHYQTVKVLAEWLELREELIRKARIEDPSVQEPKELVINQKAGQLTGITQGSVYYIIHGLSRRTGIKFANHTLRRTFGRMHWLAGTRIETLSAMMGHTDTAQTLQYIGIQMDDMTNAMKGMHEFEQELDQDTRG